MNRKKKGNGGGFRKKKEIREFSFNYVNFEKESAKSVFAFFFKEKTKHFF